MTERVLFRYDDPHGVGGPVLIRWQTGKSGSLIATAGGDGSVVLFTRQGVLQERIILQGIASSIEWDFEGDLLGIITHANSQLVMWDANTRKRQNIEIGLRDAPTVLAWSKSKQLIAVGTSRGNLSLYNHQTQRRIPILGKHSKRITCGCWSSADMLALISDDKTLSISNEDGDSLKLVQLRDTPSDLHFARMKTDDGAPDAENVVSLILGQRTMFLYNIAEPDAPLELGFQQHYGQITHHKWIGDGALILLGFSMGHIVITNPREVGQELFHNRNHQDGLSGVAVNDERALVASCGGNSVKIHSIDPETGRLEEGSGKVLTSNEPIQSLRWNDDGQLLAIATTQGGICVFVTQLNGLHSSCWPNVALLSNLSEVSVYKCRNDLQQPERKILSRLPAIVTLNIEPAFISVGPRHLACGLNNHVAFYDLRHRNDSNVHPLHVGNREYMTEVIQVKLNKDYCAVLCSTGHVTLQPIDMHSGADEQAARDSITFPDAVASLSHNVITNINLTSQFLILATDLGQIVHFDLTAWHEATQYRHPIGIKELFADESGSRVIFTDSNGVAHFYLPGSAQSVCLSMPTTPKDVATLFLWDTIQSSLFVGFSEPERTIHICTFIRYSVAGPKVEKIASMTIGSQYPLMLMNGELVLLNSSRDGVSTMPLVTHKRQESKLRQLEILKKLRNLSGAWSLCKTIVEKNEYIRLAEFALEHLDVSLAIQIYRHLGGHEALVFTLESMVHINDTNLLQGLCAMALNDTERSLKIFTKSSSSVTFLEALDLCRDLLQWEQALAMCPQVAPHELYAISLEYAQQLEFEENHREALLQYEKALSCSSDAPNSSVHEKLCKGGIARTCLRSGDPRRGIQLAKDLRDSGLALECGRILSKQNSHIQDAVELFEMGSFWDEACELYIQMQNWAKVETLLPKIKNSQMHLSYAKACEKSGKFDKAVRHLRTAGDMDGAVRLYLTQLNDVHSAQEIVMETKSLIGARMLAQFFQKIGDFETAIQYLIESDSIDEAMSIAKRQNKLRAFGEHLEKADSAKPGHFITLAKHFEDAKFPLMAGKYYFLAREFGKALKHLIKAATFKTEDDDLALSLAIDCVATANNETLTSQLIEFLLGDTADTPRDPKYLFRLYMAKKQFRDAAKTAVIIAQQEQMAGNYRNAHDLLYSMCQELKQNKLPIGSDLNANLVLLHRYILSRIHVKLGNHDLAARLLIIIANSISYFPAHTVPILTSTVIECHRAGYQYSAFKFASQLMRAEYRPQIDPKYAKKMEAIVRRATVREKSMDAETVMHRPCPNCSYSELGAMDVICGHCKVALPFCIATGQHIEVPGLAMCPQCQFPCMREAMAQVLDSTQTCPMCNETVDSSALLDVVDVEQLMEQ